MDWKKCAGVASTFEYIDWTKLYIRPQGFAFRSYEQLFKTFFQKNNSKMTKLPNLTFYK